MMVLSEERGRQTVFWKLEHEYLRGGSDDGDAWGNGRPELDHHLEGKVTERAINKTYIITITNKNM